ncbi:MAG: GAF and ANTAR domain-containing protein, partial [Actinomycetia bacterium]|nr:GAF and ANTAR domain-containing protein [Actinomycetes bacterium]
IAPSGPLVVAVDALQYELEEGGCFDSSWSGGTLLCQDLASDQRWPRWGPRAAEMGFHSLIAAELTHAEGRRVGAVSMYWTDEKRFTRDDIAYTQIFARHAALALSTSLQVEGLNVALDTRKLIGQAQGILMERYSLDADRAFEVLRRYSQDHNVKLHSVAEQLVATRELPEPAPLRAD